MSSPEDKKESLSDFFKENVFKVSNPDSRLSMPTKENVKKFLTPDPNFMPTYQGLIEFFPFYAKSYENNPIYDEIYKNEIKAKRDTIEKNIREYKVKFEDTFKRGKENIIEKRNTKEKYAREDRLILDNDVKGVTGYLTGIAVASFNWFATTTISGIKNMFTTGWNKTITGFLIIVFIIILIFVIPKMKKGKKKDGANKQDGSIMSIILSIPQDFSMAFNDFSLIIGDITDSVNNTMEFANNTVKSMNASMPDLRERGREKDGRGGDNLFHIKGSHIKDDSFYKDKIYNIYKPNDQDIGRGQIIKSKQNIDKYELDCASLTVKTYIDSNCRLKEMPIVSTTNTINKDTTDYINIDLN
jgi:hypothetical protein